MIYNGYDDWNTGIKSACEGESIDIVQLMIENGADDLDLCLQYALHEGLTDIAKLLVINGAKLKICI